MAPPTHMETAVTRLLVSTRQLLESLTNWSNGQMTDQDVSDIYVKLGNDFNTAVAAFGAFGIPMDDLSSVPADLRTCLESALGMEPNTENLNIYLPDIRNIIVTLLQGLKNKQAVYRRTIRERTGSSSNRADQIAESSKNARLTSVSPSRQPGAQEAFGRPPYSRDPSPDGTMDGRSFSTPEARTPTRIHTSEPRIGSYHQQAGGGSAYNPSLQAPVTEPRQKPVPHTRGGLPSRPNMGSPLPPAPPDAFRPPRQRSDARTPSPTPPFPYPLPVSNGIASDTPSPAFRGPTYQEPVRHRLTDPPATSPTSETTPRNLPPPRPTPPPRRQTPPSSSRFSLDSDVDSPYREKRSSTRSSLMETAAHHSSPPILPTLEEIPTLQNAIELNSERESANTLQGQASAALTSLTALQNTEVNRRASKRYSQYQYKQMLPGHARAPSSSLLRGAADGSPQRPMRRVSRPVPPVPPIPIVSVAPPPTTITESVSREETATTDGDDGVDETLLRTPPRGDAVVLNEEVAIPPPSAQATAEPAGEPLIEEPTPLVTEIKVFLQYGRETKRVVLDFREITTIADLKGIFMSRFDYTPDEMELFPDVYIKDPATGVAYHLEEIEDIKADSLLSLNIDPLDQVRQHFDNTISTLTHEIKDLKNNIVSSRRLSTIAVPSHPHAAERLSPVVHPVDKQPLRITVSPPATPKIATASLSTGQSVVSRSSSTITSDLHTQFSEVQNLRRDLGIMRQVYVDFVAQTKTTFETLRNQTQAVREVAITKLKGSRALVETGKESLEKHSQDTVQCVETISDTVDSVKDDVLKRQIMPKQSQLVSMQSDLEEAKARVAGLREQLTLAAPSWKQTWNQELKNVLEEQQLLQHQEKLAKDLEKDVDEASGMLDTLKEYVATRQQSLGQGKLRSYQPPVESDQDARPNLLMEIRTKEIDPNKRLQAIEQQQKARQREMAEKTDDFSNELSGFVSAKKLKRTGGTEEAERLRQRRQEQQLKKMFEQKEGSDSGRPGPPSGLTSLTSNASTPASGVSPTGARPESQLDPTMSVMNAKDGKEDEGNDSKDDKAVDKDAEHDAT